MATIQELKARIDLHDLAEKLGLERPGNRGNYRCPQGNDKQPSLSIFNDGRAWKCHRCNTGGTCVDLVLHVEPGDVGAAVRRLHEIYSLPLEQPRTEQRAEKTKVEYIAERCLAQAEEVLDYLESRRISRDVIRAAIKRGTLGFNDWRSSKVPRGEPMHGGPAAAFIVRTPNPGHVAAVDMRYIEPEINGGVKTQTQGDKDGLPWVSDWKRVERAHTVYFVESAINALSIETVEQRPGYAVVALRGTGNAGTLDLRRFRGKRALICMDHDEPFPEGHPQAGHRAGLVAAWTLHERMLALDISAQLIDQDTWKHNDVNDILQAEGVDGLQHALRQIEPWIIAGQSGRIEPAFTGRRRVYLPGHDLQAYWKYRVRSDFTSVITKIESDEHGQEKPFLKELAGFRLAGISRVTIASATSTITGEEDSSPRVMFAVSVQAPRHGAQLLRRVVDDEKLHNVDFWKRFGPVWDQGAWLRMVNILERAAHIGARHAVNFVGLAFRDGEPVVNEGADCYFSKPEQQCPYASLAFPSGSREDARKVITAYQETFRANAAALTLVWAIGGHLKAFLGFWPHLQMQAAKGSGKSTLVNRLERTIAMTMFSGQSVQTEFRQLTSISCTSHPVGWDEISAQKQETINAAVKNLQEAYQYRFTRRSSDMTDFLLCAPVLLAGEDVPVRSLIGKLIRTELTNRQGPMLPDDLPQFPLRQWLDFLAKLNRAGVRALHAEQLERCRAASRATGADVSAERMAANYAAVLVAWRLLCEWADLDPAQGGFERDVIAEMNDHVRETSSDRQVWVWIIETLLSEIAASNFRFPHAWDEVDGEQCLIVRTGHIMDHLAHSNALREWYHGLPIKSDRVLKRELRSAGVIVSEDVERVFGGGMDAPRKRVAHMTALSLQRLEAFGLHATPVY